MAVKFNWDEIEAEYTRGYLEIDYETGIRKHKFPTLKELSSKFNCSIDSINKISSREEWVVKRDIYRAKIKAKIQDTQPSKLFVYSNKLDAKNLNKIEQIHKLVDLYLSKHSMIIDPEDDTLLMDEDSPTINVRELEAVLRILKESHNLSRSILGERINNESMVQEAEQFNNVENKGDSKTRQDRIKKLTSKLSTKEQAAQALLNRKKELEKLIKPYEGNLTEE